MVFHLTIDPRRAFARTSEFENFIRTAKRHQKKIRALARFALDDLEADPVDGENENVGCDACGSIRRGLPN